MFLDGSVPKNNGTFLMKGEGLLIGGQMTSKVMEKRNLSVSCLLVKEIFHLSWVVCIQKCRLEWRVMTVLSFNKRVIFYEIHEPRDRLPRYLIRNSLDDGDGGDNNGTRQICLLKD